MITVVKPEACIGCFICEMACSFHHTRKFSRINSSIKVNRSIMNGKKIINIDILKSKKKSNYPCDGCKKEDGQFCVRFCPESVFQKRGKS